MNVYTSTLFDGYWSVPVAAVVVARSPEEGALLLEIRLQEQGLRQVVDPATLILVNTDEPAAIILNNGEY